MSIVFTLVELITFTIFIDYLEAVCNAEQIYLDVLWPLPPDLLSDFLKKKQGTPKQIHLKGISPSRSQNYHNFESCFKP